MARLSIKQIWIKETLWKCIRKHRLDNPENVGQCDFVNETIEIRTRQGYFEELKTLIHELLHALDHEYDLKLSHKLIYDLEEPIARLLIDNFL